MAISLCQALIHGLDVPFCLMHWSLACCHVGCLLFPEWVSHMARQKTAKKAEFGNVARTISCIARARPRERIQILVRFTLGHILQELSLISG